MVSIPTVESENDGEQQATTERLIGLPPNFAPTKDTVTIGTPSAHVVNQTTNSFTGMNGINSFANLLPARG
jgi:hypothetical protein